MPMLFWQLRLSDLPRIRSLFLCSPLKNTLSKMFKFSVLSTEKAAGENVLPLRELPCLCLMICVNIIKKAAKVLAAIFMIFYLTERKFVVLFLDRVTGYEPVGRGFESLLAHHVGARFTLLRRFLYLWQKWCGLPFSRKPPQADCAFTFVGALCFGGWNRI